MVKLRLYLCPRTGPDARPNACPCSRPYSVQLSIHPSRRASILRTVTHCPSPIAQNSELCAQFSFNASK
jgi:hypothetical protein